MRAGVVWYLDYWNLYLCLIPVCSWPSDECTLDWFDKGPFLLEPTWGILFWKPMAEVWLSHLCYSTWYKQLPAMAYMAWWLQGIAFCGGFHSEKQIIGPVWLNGICPRLQRQSHPYFKVVEKSIVLCLGHCLRLISVISGNYGYHLTREEAPVEFKWHLILSKHS